MVYNIHADMLRNYDTNIVHIIQLRLLRSGRCASSFSCGVGGRSVKELSRSNLSAWALQFL